jgi:hypothetical protein
MALQNLGKPSERLDFAPASPILDSRYHPAARMGQAALETVAHAGTRKARLGHMRSPVPFGAAAPLEKT